MSLVRTDDVRIKTSRALMPPEVLMSDLSVGEEEQQFVAGKRGELEAILSGEDDRLAVVVGPCSIHDGEAAREYAQFLLEQEKGVQEDLLLVMRVYFEKPRTTVGWKGFINDPQMDGSCDIHEGLRRARALLLDLTKMGVASGTEFLDTISPQYVADLIAWGAIGARTVESQVHRELASGLSMPVGFKNGTGGGMTIAADALEAAAHPHHFLSVTKQGVSAIVSTEGNPSCHVILRGSKQGPNYGPAAVQEVVETLQNRELQHRVMIDCSHGNSEKDFRRQPAVASAIAEQVGGGNDAIFGVMIESHLKEGRQDIGGDLEYGQSVTDACVGLADTKQMLQQLAEAVRQRREGGAE